MAGFAQSGPGLLCVRSSQERAFRAAVQRLARSPHSLQTARPLRGGTAASSAREQRLSTCRAAVFVMPKKASKSKSGTVPSSVWAWSSRRELWRWLPGLELGGFCESCHRASGLPWQPPFVCRLVIPVCGAPLLASCRAAWACLGLIRGAGGREAEAEARHDHVQDLYRARAQAGAPQDHHHEELDESHGEQRRKPAHAGENEWTQCRSVPRDQGSRRESKVEEGGSRELEVEENGKVSRDRRRRTLRRRRKTALKASSKEDTRLHEACRKETQKGKRYHELALHRHLRQDLARGGAPL